MTIQRPKDWWMARADREPDTAMGVGFTTDPLPMPAKVERPQGPECDLNDWVRYANYLEATLHVIAKDYYHDRHALWATEALK